jgi:ferritin-like metal-binding protein YciE
VRPGSLQTVSQSELDGVWRVERVSGALPPLYGVRKRIAGAEGETLVGRVPLRFDVDGLRLRYRFPLTGLVDELEPDDEGRGFHGRAMMGGRELGRFRMLPVRATTTDGGVVDEETRLLLRRHVDEAIAMEQNVLRMLDSFIATTDDAEIQDELRQHRDETGRQADRLRERLDALGGEPSVVREAGGMLAAVMKSVVDAARGEKAGRNARDAYATEHMEIASYQLLERIAERAGDAETAEVARQNRAEEEAMAERIEAHWDRFAELSLREAGLVA